MFPGSLNNRIIKHSIRFYMYSWHGLMYIYDSIVLGNPIMKWFIHTMQHNSTIKSFIWSALILNWHFETNQFKTNLTAKTTTHSSDYYDFIKFWESVEIKNRIRIYCSRINVLVAIAIYCFLSRFCAVIIACANWTT